MNNNLLSIKINENDNCAVAIQPLSKGDTVAGVLLLDDIPSGHKFALADISENHNIIKYGNAIGHATADIKAGQHIHTHNLKTNLSGVLTYAYEPDLTSLEKKEGTFQGYKRDNGEVGIRNEIWIVNTVGCVNKIAERVAKLANERFAGRTDGIFTFVHPFGCSQLGEDHSYTQKILKNMVTHPNAAGVLVLSLGCENNNLKEFKKVLGETDEKRVKFLVTQDVEDEIETALEKVGQLVAYAETFKREAVSLSHLTIGLKCGGSDGFSGITANPLVGKISDMLVSYGGTTILTEVPEMFGAEELLMNRCENTQTFDNTVSLINNFKHYFMKYNQEIYENPSPGNKDGGISTLEDKSLGCTQKAGRSNVVDVLNYGDVVTKKGLNLLNGPGNDLVAMTNLMAAHAHIILFTTGRGTPVGTAIPTLKISSNSLLAHNKKNWIDFNAGAILEGNAIDVVAEQLFSLVVDVANGDKQAQNEINDYREISIFKDGVTL